MVGARRVSRFDVDVLVVGNCPGQPGADAVYRCVARPGSSTPSHRWSWRSRCGCRQTPQRTNPSIAAANVIEIAYADLRARSTESADSRLAVPSLVGLAMADAHLPDLRHCAAVPHQRNPDARAPRAQALRHRSGVPCLHRCHSSTHPSPTAVTGKSSPSTKAIGLTPTPCRSLTALRLRLRLRPSKRFNDFL